MSFEQNDFEKRLLKNKLLNSQTNPNEQTDAQTYTIPPLWLLDWAFSRSARQKSEFSCWTKASCWTSKKTRTSTFCLRIMLSIILKDCPQPDTLNMTVLCMWQLKDILPQRKWPLSIIGQNLEWKVMALCMCYLKYIPSHS